MECLNLHDQTKVTRIKSTGEVMLKSLNNFTEIFSLNIEIIIIYAKHYKTIIP